MTPDEDKKRQSAHADRIRVERALIDLTGASRTQIRRSMREFQAAIVPVDKPKAEQQKQSFIPLNVSAVEQKVVSSSSRGGGTAPVTPTTQQNESTNNDTSLVTPMFKLENGTLRIYQVAYTTVSNV